MPADPAIMPDINSPLTWIDKVIKGTTGMDKGEVMTRTHHDYISAEDVYSGPIGYMGRAVGPEYIITITDNRPRLHQATAAVRSRLNAKRQKVVIRALLQEQFDMTTEANWAPFSAASFVSGFTNELSQLITGRAMVNRWLTRRIWRGSSPLDFTLNMRFEAEDNTSREVLAPCKELHRMCLPYRGEKAMGQFFLSPPGPSPFTHWARKGESIGEIIDISIGGLVYIKRCVVKSVKVSFFNRFEIGGNPVGANVQINFQTFEIQTKESIDTEVYSPLKPIQHRLL